MKYVSTDIETTSIDPKNGQILEIGMIIEDTEKKLPYDKCPKFQCLVEHEVYKGDAFALSMNHEILAEIAVRKTIWKNGEPVSGFHNEDITVERMTEFLIDNGVMGNGKKVNFAGKNFGAFDLQFLKRVEYFDQDIKYHHRFLDPSILFMDWKQDQQLPNLTTCKERAGLDRKVKHRVLEDCWDVIQLLRKFY